MKLIQQGAEAKIFLNEKENLIIKDRISKVYRHSKLDRQIRKRRTKAETKLLEKASKIINAPDPFPLKEINIIKMPLIRGKKLSEYLDKFPLKEQKQIMKLIGQSIAKLHKADIIHGDLTTSNMILVKPNSKNSKQLTTSNLISQHEVSANIQKKSGWAGLGKNPKVFFIDFGLGFISKKIEDKAVDLHLLKQALEAKHFTHWKTLYKEVEKSYSKTCPDSKKIFERIVSVEHRGRYRH